MGLRQFTLRVAFPTVIQILLTNLEDKYTGTHWLWEWHVLPRAVCPCVTFTLSGFSNAEVEELVVENKGLISSANDTAAHTGKIPVLVFLLFFFCLCKAWTFQCVQVYIKHLATGSRYLIRLWLSFVATSHFHVSLQEVLCRAEWGIQIKLHFPDSLIRNIKWHTDNRCPLTS